MTNYKTGDKVYIHPANSVRYQGIWTVEKVNPANYKLTREGSARRLNAPHELVSDVPEGMTQTAAGTAQDVPIGVPYREPFTQGTVVLWKKAPAKAAGQVFVVIKDDGGPTVARMVLLGSDGGRYWRQIPASALTEVDGAMLRKVALSG